MELSVFLASLLACVALVGAALFYLRSTTRRVLLALCGQPEGAAFWLRATDVLALSGSLLLVLAFGGWDPKADWVWQLRLSLGLTLAGLFFTVFIVASTVWRQVAVRPAAVGAADATTPVEAAS